MEAPLIRFCIRHGSPSTLHQILDVSLNKPATWHWSVVRFILFVLYKYISIHVRQVISIRLLATRNFTSLFSSKSPLMIFVLITNLFNYPLPRMHINTHFLLMGECHMYGTPAMTNSTANLIRREYTRVYSCLYSRHSAGISIFPNSSFKSANTWLARLNEVIYLQECLFTILWWKNMVSFKNCILYICV